MYIATDPGLMCGLFAVSREGVILCAMEAPPYETIHRIETMLEENDNVTVIGERYTITQQTIHMTRQMEAAEVLGAIRYLTQKHRARLIISGRETKKRVSNTTLKTVGWHNTTHGGHLNDAARHCLITYVKENPGSDAVKKIAGMVEPGEVWPRTR